jgi:hypothetical protein
MHATGTLLPISRDAAGLPRTFRLHRPVSNTVAYRRLAAAILRLDVKSLTSDLRTARLAGLHEPAHGARLQRAA